MSTLRFASILAVAIAVLAVALFFPELKKKRDPIKIGILHSLTGHMAVSEKPVVDAILLAVSEINSNGGLLGADIETVIADGKSDDETFAKEAERLISKEKVLAIFGCWTSSCRKAVAPIVEQHNSLLVYPLQYEGLESSPNILYTGSTPNQQIVPAMHWAMEKFGRRMFLVGSDYIFPRTANLIMRKVAETKGAVIIGESYIPLDSHDVDAVVAEIAALKPDVVLNTINGQTNFAFFSAIKKSQGDKPVPIISFSLSEAEVVSNPSIFTGSYASWGYFQSIDSERNREFTKLFHAKHGNTEALSDPMEAAYIGVKIWAHAVRDAGSPDTGKVRRFLVRQTLDAPQGIVSVSRINQHLWRASHIGRARDDGHFDIVWSAPYPLRPNPYPSILTKAEWMELAGQERR